MKYEAHNSERLEELFHALSELDAAGRKEFLEANCSADPELRDALERLLNADEEATKTTLLSTPALHLEARELASGGDLPLDRLGPYRILSRLGSGGMGIVYLADRDDGQFRMKVAVKMVACAFQDESVAVRFRHERQILANLDHPNITRLLDGGVTASGSPYLVMEYVDGSSHPRVRIRASPLRSRSDHTVSPGFGRRGICSSQPRRASRSEAGQYPCNKYWHSQTAGFRHRQIAWRCSAGAGYRRANDDPWLCQSGAVARRTRDHRNRCLLARHGTL